jgi:hypothetical protein
MAKYDFYMNIEEDNDLILDEKGEFTWVPTIQESLAQRLDLRYKTWTGEWVYNTEFGTPYRRYMKGGFTKQQLDAEFARIALLEEDVTSVKNIISTLDNVNRSYVIDRIEVYTDGGLIEIPLSSPYTKTNNYPEPYSFDDFLFCKKTEEEIQGINNLYGYVNYDGLPITGSSTWWNIWK